MCTHTCVHSVCLCVYMVCVRVRVWMSVHCAHTCVHGALCTACARMCMCVHVLGCTHVCTCMRVLCVRMCRSVPAVTVVSRMPVQVRSTQSGVDGGQTHATADTCSPPGPASGKAKSQRTKAPVPREHD